MLHLRKDFIMKYEILSSIEKDLVYAIIPARSGSKGVRNKNIHILRGYPMIAYSIAVATMCNNIDRIIVSTDSDYYSNLSKYYGAEVPFLRPSELASDNSTDFGFMKHAIEWFYYNEKKVPEYFVHLRPTYPLRDCGVVNRAVEIIKNDKCATSLRSAHKADVSPFKWFLKTNENYFKPMYDDMTLDDANKPRQSFPDVFIPDGYVDVLKTESIIKNNNIHGDRMIGYVVNDGIDVDNLKDMEKLEILFNDIDFPILSYLQSHYNPMETTK